MKRWIAIGFIAIALGGMAFAGGSQQQAEAPSRVTVAIDEPVVETFLFWTGRNWEYLDMMLEPLVGNDPVTGELTNDRIAESWEHNSNFTTWTFRIRPGIQFHNDWGEVTSADVVHSFALQTGDDSVIPGVEQVRDGRVTAVDQYTVRFEFPSPRRDFAFNVAGRATFFIYSKRQYDQGGVNAYETQPSGTGHFQYVRHSPGTVLYRRVDNHYSGFRPDFEELELRLVSEPSTRLAMLRTGEAHIAELPRELHRDAIGAGFGIVSSSLPSMQTDVVFNGLYLSSEEEPEIRARAQSLPWADVRIREAINRAINREEMLDVLFEGRAGLVVRYAMHGPHEGYDPTLKERFEQWYGYNPDRARQLMAEAGYPHRFADPVIPLIRTSLHGQPELDVQTDLIYEYLTAVGFQARIVEMDSASMLALGRNRGLFYLNPIRNAPIRPTESAIIAFYTRPGGPAQGYETDKGIGLVQQIVNTIDAGRREVLIKELFNYLFETYNDIPLFEVHTEMVVNNDVVAGWVYPGVTSYGYGHWHMIKKAQ